MIKIRRNISEINSQPTGGKPFALVEGSSSKANELLEVRNTSFTLQHYITRFFAI